MVVGRANITSDGLESVLELVCGSVRGRVEDVMVEVLARTGELQFSVGLFVETGVWLSVVAVVVVVFRRVAAV